MLTTWEEFVVDLGISGLCILGLRPLLSRYNNNKDSTSLSSYKQARKTVKFKLHCVKFQINACKCYIHPRTLETIALRPHPSRYEKGTCFRNSTLNTSCKHACTLKITMAFYLYFKQNFLVFHFSWDSGNLVLRPHPNRKYIQYLLQEQYTKQKLKLSV